MQYKIDDIKFHIFSNSNYQQFFKGKLVAWNANWSGTFYTSLYRISNEGLSSYAYCPIFYIYLKIFEASIYQIKAQESRIWIIM